MSAYDFIRIRWGPPKEAGNTPITYYCLIIKGPGYFSNKTHPTGTVNSAKYEHNFIGLKPNTTYKVSVFAYNKVGKGIEATQSYQTVLYGKPGNIIIFSKAVRNCDTIRVIRSTMILENVCILIDYLATTFAILLSQCGNFHQNCTTIREITRKWGQHCTYLK